MNEGMCNASLTKVIQLWYSYKKVPYIAVINLIFYRTLMGLFTYHEITFSLSFKFSPHLIMVHYDFMLPMTTKLLTDEPPVNIHPTTDISHFDYVIYEQS